MGDQSLPTLVKEQHAEIERLRAQRDEYYETNETLLAYQAGQRKEVDRLRAERDRLLAALKEIDEVSFLHHAQRLARAAIAAVEEKP